MHEGPFRKRSPNPLSPSYYSTFSTVPIQYSTVVSVKVDTVLVPLAYHPGYIWRKNWILLNPETIQLKNKILRTVKIVLFTLNIEGMNTP